MRGVRDTVIYDEPLKLMVPKTFADRARDAAAALEVSLSEYVRAAIRERMARDRKRERADA